MNTPLLPEEVATIRTIIEGVVQSMGLEAVVQPEDTVTKGLVFNIGLGTDSYLLIGHRGAHLHSLEVLVQAMVARAFQGRFVRFSLDVDDYRRKREWYIKETVRGAVEQIKRTGRATALVPMPSFERKLVHAILTEQYPDIESASSGVDPRRRVVIRLKPH